MATRYAAFWHTKPMAEEKSLDEILSEVKELRRTADELIKASENLMAKYERLRRRAGNDYKKFADRARDLPDEAREASERHKCDVS